MQESSLPVRKQRPKETEEALKPHLDGFDQILRGAEASSEERSILQGEVPLEEEQPKKGRGKECMVWRIISIMCPSGRSRSGCTLGGRGKGLKIGHRLGA